MFKHLEQTKQKYFDHFMFAFKASIQLQAATIASLLHAFFPDIFPFTAEKITKKLYNESIVRQNSRK